MALNLNWMHLKKEKWYRTRKNYFQSESIDRSVSGILCKLKDNYAHDTICYEIVFVSSTCICICIFYENAG